MADRLVSVNDDFDFPAPVAARILAKAMAASGAVLLYKDGAYPARPTGVTSAKYIGPVLPTTWLPNDEWVDNS